jgi:hypothetical protein
LHNDGERTHLTVSPNLEVECAENGTATMTIEPSTTVESIDLSISGELARQQVNIQRDTWGHKVEFLLAVIGYAVDLGKIHSCSAY